MSLRIQGGKYKGRLIQSPKGDARPTMGWARGVIFNWLYFLLPGKRVLDACSGSGAMAFESLSLGAQEAVCLDQDSDLVRGIQKQADIWGLPLLAREHHWPERFVSGSFDIIFWDPPYDAPWRGDIFALITATTLLHEGGLLLVESRAGDADQGHFDPMLWERLKSHKRGQTELGLYRLKAYERF